MSNGMRSCAQDVRGAVITLQPVMAFCHKKLGLLNKRVSTVDAELVAKTQGMGQKARPDPKTLTPRLSQII